MTAGYSEENALFLTTCYHKILSIDKKIKVVQGGQGSGKNWAIAMILLFKAVARRLLITIMTDSFPNLEDGAIQDFKEIYNILGWDFEKDWNASKHDLKVNDSIIQFRHLGDKTIGKSKRRDILYINEANKIGWEPASSFIGRTREDVYIDFNPDREGWMHTEIPKLKDDDGNSVSELIVTTWHDNEKIPDWERQYIESRKDNEAWYRIFGLGLTGFYSERQIYKFEIVDEIPEDAEVAPAGLDFGNSPDPTGLGDIRVKGNDLYCREVFCETDLMAETIRGADKKSVADKFREIEWDKNRLTIADSSGAKQIADLRFYGYNVEGVKGRTVKGAQLAGINLVRGYNLKFLKGSDNLIRSANNWFFKEDKKELDADGNLKIVPEPQGHEPDLLAGLRYAVMEIGQPSMSDTAEALRHIVL